MSESYQAIIITEAHLMPKPVNPWGTGGWLPPQTREALDWVIMLRFMGWESFVVAQNLWDPAGLLPDSLKCIIVAIEPEKVQAEFMNQLLHVINTRPVLCLIQAGNKSTALFQCLGISVLEEKISGRKVVSNPDPSLFARSCRSEIYTRKLAMPRTAEVWAQLDQEPLLICLKHGAGRIVSFGFQASESRDWDGAFTALLRHTIIYGSKAPVAWLNWENTLVLRMDDPGSSETVYHEIYTCNKLGSEEWAAIGRELQKRKAKITLGYVSGWVDDGNPARGQLTVNGKPIERIPGKVHPSPHVKYGVDKEKAQTKLYDYESEFQGIQKLRQTGLAEVELHGYTHIHPEKETWLAAPDQYTNQSWYREFGRSSVEYLRNIPAHDHPLNKAIATFEQFFQSQPVALICPGEEFTNDIVVYAQQLGLSVISSYYLAIRINNRFCWTQHVCAPYLDLAASEWFDAGLPVVGYFHDFDIAERGVNWFSQCLDAWQHAGAKHIFDLKELAARTRLNLKIQATDHNVRLDIYGDKSPSLAYPLEIMIRLADSGEIPASNLKLCIGREQEQWVSLESYSSHIASLTIQPGQINEALIL